MFRSILKKLFRKKVFKLGLVGTSLLGLMISSGFSFAKYIDTNYGNGNAGAARFGVSVTNNTKFIYLPDDLSTFKSGYYAFVADFSVDFTKCEVKTQYNLNLKICEEYSTDYDNPYPLKYSYTYFQLPTLSTGNSYVNYTIVEKDEYTHEFKEDNVASYLTNGAITTTFKEKTLYYAFSKDGSTYNWNPTYSTSVTNYEVIIKNIPANVNEIHHFKIVYFTQIGIQTSSDGNYGDVTYTASFGNSIILSKIELEQVV